MALNVPLAIRLIPFYANSVGWRDDLGRVCGLLGFKNFYPDAATFVTAVYKWQLTHHLDADGSLGPDTWKKMKPTLPSASGRAPMMGPNPAWVSDIEIPEITIFVRSKESKDEFLQRCGRAVGKVQTATLQFHAWLSGIAFAYGAAFEAHTTFLEDIKAAIKIADDLVLGLALAFLGGGVGGMVGATMKKITSSDFAIDGIKDIAKFAVRTPAGQALRPPSLKAMPQSPSLWQNAIDERVTKEMAEVSKQIDAWSKAVDEGDVTFDAGFDPVGVVEKALVMHVPDPIQVMHLPEVDKDSLQVNFEKGWLVGWIELGQVSHVPYRRAITRDKCIAYGRKLGLANIDELVDKHIPNEGSTMTQGGGAFMM